MLDLDTEKNSDFIEVRNGNKDGFLLEKYSGNDMKDRAVTTSESTMWVQFRSDFEGSGKGFRAIIVPGMFGFFLCDILKT